MKQFLLAFGLLFASLSLQAQQNYDLAFGLRAGNPSGFTGKYFFAQADYHAIEGILGLNFETGLGLTGLYEFHGYIGEGASWYFGGGGSLYYFYKNQQKEVYVGVDGILGVEYTFYNFPVNFSIDWKPQFGTGKLYTWYNAFGLSIRYAFWK